MASVVARATSPAGLSSATISARSRRAASQRRARDPARGDAGARGKAARGERAAARASRRRRPAGRAAAAHERHQARASTGGFSADARVLPGFRSPRDRRARSGLRVFELARGASAFDAGEPAEAAFLVIRGALEIFAPQGASQRRVAIAGPGELSAISRCSSACRTLRSARIRESACLMELGGGAFPAPLPARPGRRSACCTRSTAACCGARAHQYAAHPPHQPCAAQRRATARPRRWRRCYTARSFSGTAKKNRGQSPISGTRSLGNRALDPDFSAGTASREALRRRRGGRS